ncbi:hypothetical protein [Salirhabdus sp. Marseille-P4669]|uniref:hypothetical protein n=1 Tax=Salirhabdus sp. Marseille-P4669 TaxID=2042310 RepID=UPI000C7A3FD1|nr:hypothetical protein [Salirhabdus sp. Marseille-P4669]
MGLYTYSFCQGILYANLDSGVIDNLEDARHEILQNFNQMDLDNASVQEEMRDIVDDMVSEIDRLINRIQSVSFR